MVLQFNPPPVRNEPSMNEQFFEPAMRIAGLLSQYYERKDAQQSRKRMEEIARQREAREQAQSNFDYGTRQPMGLTDQNYGTGGLTFDQSLRSTLSPETSRFAMGGTNAPMAPMTSQSQGPRVPESGGLVDRFRQWQQSKRTPDYSGIGLSPDDVTAAVGDTSGFSDIGEKRRDSILKFAKEKREQGLSGAREDYYKRSRMGGGRGGVDPKTATYANLVAQRNQLLRQKEYALPDSPEEREAQSMIDDIDQELLTRRGKPVLSRAGGTQPPSNKDAGVIEWLKSNFPSLKNPTAKDITWARGRMSAPAR